MLYQRILLAIDFSEPGRAATKHAVELCQAFGAELSVLHVVEIPAVYGLGYMGLENMQQRYVGEAEPRLKAYLKEFGMEDYSALVRVGSPRQEIVRAVMENKIDLLVLGSHGRYGVSDMIGSTVNSVLQRIQCNVLIVHPEEQGE